MMRIRGVYLVLLAGALLAGCRSQVRQEAVIEDISQGVTKDDIVAHFGKGEWTDDSRLSYGLKLDGGQNLDGIAFFFDEAGALIGVAPEASMDSVTEADSNQPTFEAILELVGKSDDDVGIFLRDYEGLTKVELSSLNDIEALNIFLTVLSFFEEGSPFIDSDDETFVSLLASYPQMKRFLRTEKKDSEEVYFLERLKNQWISDVISGRTPDESE